MEMNDLLIKMVELDASDLHLMADTPPAYRIHGDIVNIGDPISAEEVERLIKSMMSTEALFQFATDLEYDFSIGVEGVSRFRANVFNERGHIAAAIRTIPHKIRTFDELHLPPIIKKLCDKPRGLVLVTGPTGSGKSTTLAAMIDAINDSKHGHIITLEDPIEYIHKNKKCIVSQREIHTDSLSFARALKSILRQDPDTVLIGEMRDVETIGSALIVSETGHLTFGTLHTNNAVQTINRIIEVFPQHEQQQVRTQLSFVLEGVISQQLLQTADGKGRVMALEVMIPTPAIRTLIRDDKIHQIYGNMQTGQSSTGMLTMTQSLVGLAKTGKITKETALAAATMPDEVRLALGLD